MLFTSNSNLYCLVGVFYFVVHITNCQQLYQLDYSHKKKVSVSDALKDLQEPKKNDDSPWGPPVKGDGDSVTINILGQPVDRTALNHLRPDTSPRQQRKLAKILGDNFDPEWTSINPPREVRDQNYYVRDTESDKKQVDPVLALEVRKLNMTFTDGLGQPYQLSDHLSEMFQSWLLNHATCKLNYVWESVGPLFWPSWIRRGLCNNSQQCSWPRGMTCHPTSSRTVKLLHWKCTQGTDSPKMKRWIDRKRRRARRDRRKDRKRGMQRDEGRRKRRRSRDNLSVRQRHARRARRLIRKLSKTSAGYHCEWNVKSYVTNDRCACTCG